MSGNPEAQCHDKLHTSFYEVASMASKTEERCMIVMTILDKLKDKLILNVSCSGSGQTSHHTLSAVTISNEVINGTSKECIKVLSPLVARSKGGLVLKRKEFKANQEIRKLKTRKRQEGNKTSRKKGKGKQVLAYLILANNLFY